MINEVVGYQRVDDAQVAGRDRVKQLLYRRKVIDRTAAERGVYRKRWIIATD